MGSQLNFRLHDLPTHQKRFFPALTLDCHLPKMPVAGARAPISLGPAKTGYQMYHVPQKLSKRLGKC